MLLKLRVALHVADDVGSVLTRDEGSHVAFVGTEHRNQCRVGPELVGGLSIPSFLSVRPGFLRGLSLLSVDVSLSLAGFRIGVGLGSGLGLRLQSRILFLLQSLLLQETLLFLLLLVLLLLLRLLLLLLLQLLLLLLLLRLLL
jgi:hypothetical protein